jgi:hypothetical protein
VVRALPAQPPHSCGGWRLREKQSLFGRGVIGGDEFQQVGIDPVCIRRGHAVWESRVGLERAMLQKLDGPCSGGEEGANQTSDSSAGLIIV